jgi:alcohol dehydrogenase class IV
VGRAGILTNLASRQKKIIFHPRLMPTVVICDPALTVGMPRAITAGTGMDALAHCLEAYCSPHYHPMSQGIALEGMRLVFENLPLVHADPTNLDARGHMMSAALMGAVAFQKGLGAIHSLSHPVGAVYGTHHGTTNAVVMPMVLDFNRHAIEDKIEAVARYLAIRGGFDGFRAAVMDLRDLLGIPETLSDLGVQADQLDALTDMALQDPSCGGNPVKMTRENTRALFHDCM